MVKVIESSFSAGLIPRQREDEPNDDGFPQWLARLRKERNLAQPAVAFQSTLEVIQKLSQALSENAAELILERAQRGTDGDLRFWRNAGSRLNNEEKKLVRSGREGLLLTHAVRQMVIWHRGR